MATEIGIIKTLIGTVTAKSSTGILRTLKIDEVVFQNETISTGEFSAVEIELSDGSLIDLGRSSETTLNPSLVADITPESLSISEEVNAIQQTIASGDDPTQNTEPTAAGANGQDSNEGSTIIEVQHLAPETTPTSGFDTTGLNFAFDDEIEQIGEELQTLESDNFINSLPSIGDNDPISLDDDTLGGNAGGINDNNPDNVNLTGTLSFEFGNDGPGTVLLSNIGAPLGFTYILTNGGTTLTVNQSGTDILEVTLTDPTSGDYSITQLAPLRHESGDNENNQLLDITYLVTDGNGDSVPGSININIDDDTPTVSRNALVRLDDDALTDGNPGGRGDNPDSQNTVGTLAHSYGADGEGSTLLLATGAPSGFDYNLNGDGTILTISQNGTDVIRVSLTDTTSGDYTVEQLAPVDHRAGGRENNQAFNINYQTTDNDGDAANGRMQINVDDDSPIAVIDTNIVTEGASVAGNVFDNDAIGADNTNATAAVIGIATGSSTNAVLGNLTTPLIGTFGELTLRSNGSYTYNATADNITADAQDIFTYTIEDNDGDRSTVTLTIDVADVSLIPVNVSETANEAGLPTGSDASNSSETVTGQLAVAGHNVSYAFSTGNNGAGNNGTLTLNNDGSYSYTLNTPVASGANPGANTVNDVETFNYLATDTNGNTVEGTITINVIDDVPIAAAEITPLLQESFENLLTDRSSGWGTFFNNGGTYIGDQGTSWTVNQNGLEAQKLLNSTLSASDGDVHLELDTSRNSSISTNITLTKSDVSLSFDYKPRTGGGDSNMKVTLDGREITIDAQNTASAIITTPDGVTASQTLNPSGWFSITLNFTDLTTGDVTLEFEGAGRSNSYGALLDNIQLAENFLQVDESELGTNATHDFSSYFAGTAGADGLGDYILTINNDDTGLRDTATGENISLSFNATTGDIEGRTATSNDLVFTVSVDNAGVVTVDQISAIAHPNNSQTNSVIKLPAGLIGLAITDSDGDTSPTQLDISPTISFLDDIPTITNLASATNQDSFVENASERVTEVQSDPANRAVDHWQFHHDGGQLVIDLNSERYHGDLDGDGDQTVFDSYMYLFSTNQNGDIENVITRNDDSGSPSTLDSLISINLPEANYDLAVGAWPFTEAEARTDTHDRAMGTYNLTFSGDNEGIILDSSPSTGSVLNSTIDVETTTATLSVGHNIDIDVGADNAGSSIDFTLEEVTILGDLTSNGLAVTFEARDTDADGDNDQIIGSTADGDVLSIEGILDSNAEVHLFAPVESSNVGTDDVQITASLSISDGDGDTAATTLNFNLDINQVLETVPQVDPI